ncbi:hypothetical protein BKA67DRAFT_645459 [Truncatella angustata]|uniref:Rhodopsin domain-containing protein n=1 Tax=Truncatella angustata TaxID=152316 RepID=A0A9P9A0F7_9PEZI|nr:uncharacterized protein BKA67DRAFT_645459 [Truncatella angustata]KAH6656065.1 hypothetical protein BKA67DRAFT_645459 [Truncatella angustata]KAH8198409.1 hypothetical protein TruAng_007444 [Truncatella angustata]
MAGSVDQLSIRSDGGQNAVDTNAPSILGISSTLMALSFIVVAARCYVRLVMLKSFSIDDAVMLVALVMAILSMVCFIQMVHYGAGRLEGDIPADWWSGLNFWSYIIGPFSTTGISSVKISVAFFLRRFMQVKWASRLITGMGIFCLVFLIYSIITFMVACVPLSTFWDPQPGAKCWSGDALSLIGTINGVVNVTQDLFFVIVPIPVVLRLQVNRRTKGTLIAILSLGLFACVASVVRMVYAYHRSDPGYTRTFNFIVWFNIELHAGILAASLPTLRPLFATILKNTSRLRTYGYKSGTRYGTQSAHIRSGYQKQDDVPIHLREVNEQGNYKATIATSRAKSLEDDGSEDGILPIMNGINKRTEITIQAA